MLSGGLDSSSVVAVTAEIFKSEGRILHTYTHVPRFTGQFSNSNNTFGDESAHVRTIFEKHKNIEGNFLKSEDFSPIKSLYQYIEITSQIIQGAGAAFWALDLYSRVKSDGHDLLLTGENGNGTFSFSGVRPILPWSHPHWKNIPMRLLKDKVYLPLYSLYHELSYCDKNEIWNNNNHFLNKWSLENSDLIGHAEIEYFSLKNKLETYDQKMGNLIYLARKIRMPIGGTISSHFGFNMADPTGSEEMIEYCFSLPNEAFFGKAGATRNLVRQMMVGSLPDKIRLERKTGQQSADLVARLKYTSDEVDVALQNISSNETFKYLFDLPRINAYWNYLKNTESKLADRTMLNSFMKSLMAGLFILKYQ
jgi:asparagine synthase (glutamine-hydrolysing)